MKRKYVNNKTGTNQNKLLELWLTLAVWPHLTLSDIRRACTHVTVGNLNGNGTCECHLGHRCQNLSLSKPIY